MVLLLSATEIDWNKTSQCLIQIVLKTSAEIDTWCILITGDQLEYWNEDWTDFVQMDNEKVPWA